MSLEIPVLRLGVAGFAADQQEGIGAQLEQLSPAHVSWQLAPFAEADAWWVHGARIQTLPGGTVRVGSGVPGGRSVQLVLAEVDRPIAFSLPLASRQLEPSCTFVLDQPQSMAAALERFCAWLQPLVAQFGLAENILRNESSLGSGRFHVTNAQGLLAVVDMRGEIGILPTARPADFEGALWRRRDGRRRGIPEHFLHTDLSQVMWQYALRTRSDALPARYRTGLLYFRRPPRLPQRALNDVHLLLLRELASRPGTFEDMQQRTGLSAEPQARALAALYLVGAITSNPQRAAAGVLRRPPEAGDSIASRPQSLPSALDSRPQPVSPVSPAPRPASGGFDLTAPAPLWPE